MKIVTLAAILLAIPASSYAEKPITFTDYDVCKGIEANGAISHGCKFPYQKVGQTIAEFKIAKASPSVTRKYAEYYAATLMVCDKMADEAYIAYSKYKNGHIILVRGGRVLDKHQIDRARALDYMDPAFTLPPWPKGDAKGFLSCGEMSAEMRNSNPYHLK